MISKDAALAAAVIVRLSARIGYHRHSRIWKDQDSYCMVTGQCPKRAIPLLLLRRQS